MNITVIVEYDECTQFSKTEKYVNHNARDFVDAIKACGWHLQDRLDELKLFEDSPPGRPGRS